MHIVTYLITNDRTQIFTVYGPGWADMALLVTKLILEGTNDLFNNGNHTRDFTYIDDIEWSYSLYVL